MSRVYIGTYTETLPHVVGKANGILTADFEDGEFGKVSTATTSRNPSWLVRDGDRGLIYAINETTEFDGAVGGGITAYRELSDGSLEEISHRHSYGAEPCHGELAHEGKHVIVANYRTGQISVFASEDGELSDSPTSLVVQHGATHGNPIRQEQPHAHAIVLDPVTSTVWVPDLGQDAVIEYELDSAGVLEERTRVNLLPGEGPRHLVFHPDGRHMFVVCELANIVTVFRRNEGSAPFLRVTSTRTLPADFEGHNQTAALRMNAEGKHIYVTNRGHDSISVLEWDGTELRFLQNVLAEGREPREFVLDPSEQYALLANQDSDEIVVRPRLADGTLGEIQGRYTFETPVCITFV